MQLEKKIKNAANNSNSSLTAHSRNEFLSKEATPNQLQFYFAKVMELTQSGEEFPINLDEVWSLVYSQRNKAIQTLKKDFVEGEDFLLSQKVEQKNQRGGHNKVEYYLSVSCMEYFIAKKIKPVFEVYRKVFHKTIAQESTRIGQVSDSFKEGTIYTIPMGATSTRVSVIDGVLYCQVAPIMKLIGYSQTNIATSYIERIGTEHFQYLKVGNQNSWFVNTTGLYGLLEITTINISSNNLRAIFKVFGISHNEVNQFDYSFGHEAMQEILLEVTKSPINKAKIVQLLLKGGSHDRNH